MNSPDSLVLTFGFYFIAHGLLLTEMQVHNHFHTCRHYLGNFFVTCVVLTTMFFVLIYSLQLQDEDKTLLWAICSQKYPVAEGIELWSFADED